MDMHSREQYLESLREEYRRAGKKQKKRLLNEARKRTHLNRKVLIRKLAHPAKVRTSQKRPPRKATYGVEVPATLVQVWEIFDYPCGQRLAPVLRQELERLRKARELHCSDEVAEKLGRISAKTNRPAAGAREAGTATAKKPESSGASAVVSEDSGQSSGRVGDQPGGQRAGRLRGTLRGLEGRRVFAHLVGRAHCQQLVGRRAHRATDARSASGGNDGDPAAAAVPHPGDSSG